MIKKTTIIVSCSVLILLSGCASQDKYRKLEAEHNNAQLQMKEDKRAISNLQIQNQKLLNENQKLQGTNSALMAKLNNEESVRGQNEKSELATDELSRPYSILLSSCQKQGSVQKVLSNYKGSKMAPFVVKVDLGEKGVWWRILKGHFETREAAVDAKNKGGLSDKTVMKRTHADLMLTDDDESETESGRSPLVQEALSLLE